MRFIKIPVLLLFLSLESQIASAQTFIRIRNLPVVNDKLEYAVFKLDRDLPLNEMGDIWDFTQLDTQQVIYETRYHRPLESRKTLGFIDATHYVEIQSEEGTREEFYFQSPVSLQMVGLIVPGVPQMKYTNGMQLLKVPFTAGMEVRDEWKRYWIEKGVKKEQKGYVQTKVFAGEPLKFPFGVIKDLFLVKSEVYESTGGEDRLLETHYLWFHPEFRSAVAEAVRIIDAEGAIRWIVRVQADPPKMNEESREGASRSYQGWDMDWR